MEKKKLELLAPAGSFESLKAAVLNGADAVYLGGGKFNARINAGNFSCDDLRLALDYAHERGVKVYVTLNTLIKNDELEEALEFASFIYKEGADAVIVQDIGLLNILNRYLPGLNLHASTQMTLTNSHSILELENCGLKRVVLPREFSLREIELISKKTNIELEVFAHGALCVCYSGQCLMSGFIGGRSGNRGVCAQPCRLPWSLSYNNDEFKEPSYLLSTRDIMAIELLPELKKAGVTSLKLEGRMKSPEYVAIVTSVYRRYIDLLESLSDKQYEVYELNDQDREKLLQAFNRGGFSKGYLYGSPDFNELIDASYPKNRGVYIGKVNQTKPLYVKIELKKPLNIGDGLEISDHGRDPQSFIVTDIQKDGRHVRSIESGLSAWVGDIKAFVKTGSPVYRTLSRELFKQAENTYTQGEKPLVGIDISFVLATGSKARLFIKDEDGNTILMKSDEPAEQAIKRPLTEDRIISQLKKTGDTPYYIKNIKIEADGKGTLPISAINALRRNALDALSEKRIKKYKKQEPQAGIIRQIINEIQSCGCSKDKKQKLSAFFYRAPHSLRPFNGIISRIYIPVTVREILENYKSQFEGEIFIHTPSILKDVELKELINKLYKIEDLCDGFSYGSIGALKALRDAFPEKYLCAEYSMNIFNSAALKVQRDHGAQTAVLSAELRLSEVESFSCSDFSGIGLEALIYGRLPLMTMENCPSAHANKCSGKCMQCRKGSGYLKDRMGEIFPFERNKVLKRTQIFNSKPVFMDETEILKKTPLNLLRLAFTNEDIKICEAVAQYFFNRLYQQKSSPGLEKIIQNLKDKNGFTKGHWFMGV